MPRKAKIRVTYEAIPTPVQSPDECGGLLCLNTACKRCWGLLDDLDAIFDTTPGVTVDLDHDTYATLMDEARRQGRPASTLAKEVIQKWAKSLKAPRRGAVLR